MNDQHLLDDLLSFLQASPTAWHAVDNLIQQFKRQSFHELHLKDQWTLKPGGRYFVSCLDSSLAAFIVPKDAPISASILGTHTDSPALKLKPKTEFRQGPMVMFGVEVYGAPLLNSWLNRDLGVAGRIFYNDDNNSFLDALVNITDAPLVIPQLAIHLDRGVNDSGLLLNKETHLSALACLQDKSDPSSSYLEKLLRKEIPLKQLLSHDLFLYPMEPARFVGADHQMIAGYRLDNLCSVHSAAHALLTSKDTISDRLRLGLFWDHEEIGSGSAQGAESPFLPHLLERIMLALDQPRENYLRLLHNSLCISVDLAHALHPNYPEKHEKHHQTLLNQGVVLKMNAQQRYATSASNAAQIISLSQRLDIPLQKFVVRNDIPCGSTIGPITASLTGIPNVDIGIPQLSMHSCRELVGSKDHLYMCKLLRGFFA